MSPRIAFNQGRRLPKAARGRPFDSAQADSLCTPKVRRLVGVKAEVIQCAPANRVGVLILRKGLRGFWNS
jgi:hypothetical protein